MLRSMHFGILYISNSSVNSAYLEGSVYFLQYLKLLVPLNFFTISLVLCAFRSLKYSTLVFVC